MVTIITVTFRGPGRNLVNVIWTFKTSLNRLSTIASVISEMRFEIWNFELCTCCLATISRVLKLVSFFLLSSLYSSQSRQTLPWMFFQFGTLYKFPSFQYYRLDRPWRGLEEMSTFQLWQLAEKTQRVIQNVYLITFPFWDYVAISGHINYCLKRFGVAWSRIKIDLELAWNGAWSALKAAFRTF